MNDKLLELLRKLKEVSERGIDGEAVNAESLLHNLMKKHNITFDDISNDEIKLYSFKCDSIYDSDLLYRIVKKIDDKLIMYDLRDKKWNKTRKSLNLTGNITLECKASQFIEIDCQYSILGRDLKDAFDSFFLSFIIANELSINQDSSKIDLTYEEYIEAIRIRKMSKLIDKSQILKQLNK